MDCDHEEEQARGRGAGPRDGERGGSLTGGSTFPGGREAIPVETSESEGDEGDSEGVPSSVAELDGEESLWLA
eukprot:15469456-Alexandrium_andersonii.AAC.1